MAGLPGRDASRDALLDDEAVGDQLGDRSEIVTRVSPVSRERSARLIAPWWNSVCRTQRAVVSSGVLGKHLGTLAQHAAGTEGVAVAGSCACAGSRVE